MYNFTLMRRECRANYKIWLVFAAVLTMYGAVIIGMFDPKLGDSLAMMAESMPQLFAAFGMSSPGAGLLQFLVNYLYGFLFTCFPLVLILILVNRLLVRYLDQGAMAWLLATPSPRWKIAITQAKTLGLAVFFLVLYVTGLCAALSALLFPGELEMGRFLLVNLGLCGMLLFLAAICFTSACVFGGGRWALGAGGGLCVLFILLQMLSKTGEKLEFLRYVNPLTLFDPLKIAVGGAEALWPVLALYLGALALFGIGVTVFSKRDLCL